MYPDVYFGGQINNRGSCLFNFSIYYAGFINPYKQPEISAGGFITGLAIRYFKVVVHTCFGK